MVKQGGEVFQMFHALHLTQEIDKLVIKQLGKIVKLSSGYEGAFGESVFPIYSLFNGEPLGATWSFPTM